MKDDKKHFFFQPLVELTSSTKNTQQRLYRNSFLSSLAKPFLSLQISITYFCHTNFFDRRLIDRNSSLCSHSHANGPRTMDLWTLPEMSWGWQFPLKVLRLNWNARLLARYQWPGDLTAAGGQEMSTQTPRPEKIIYCFIRKSLKVFTEKSSEKSQGQRLILFIRF